MDKWCRNTLYRIGPWRFWNGSHASPHQRGIIFTKKNTTMKLKFLILYIATPMLCHSPQFYHCLYTFSWYSISEGFSIFVSGFAEMPHEQGHVGAETFLRFSAQITNHPLRVERVLERIILIIKIKFKLFVKRHNLLYLTISTNLC